MKIIQKGAEAEIDLIDGKIIKNRIKKSYRIPEIDEKIRKLRTRSEAKLLEKASKIVAVPKVFSSNEKTKKITLEFIDGKKLSAHLDDFAMEKQKEICRKIGENVAKLHDQNIIHGDLTTSNMIYVDNLKNKRTILKHNFGFIDSTLPSWEGGRGQKSERDCELSENKRATASQGFKIFFIDFGLGFISHKIEDRAVDLHLLKEALEAKHFQHWKILFEEVLRGYDISKNFEKVLTQLRKVEKRGRYKEQY